MSRLAILEQRLILLDLDRRIDDRRLLRLSGGDQIRGAAAALVQDLLEVHGQLPPARWRALSSANLCGASGDATMHV